MPGRTTWRSRRAIEAVAGSAASALLAIGVVVSVATVAPAAVASPTSPSARSSIPTGPAPVVGNHPGWISIDWEPAAVTGAEIRGYYVYVEYMSTGKGTILSLSESLGAHETSTTVAPGNDYWEQWQSPGGTFPNEIRVVVSVFTTDGRNSAYPDVTVPAIAPDGAVAPPPTGPITNITSTIRGGYSVVGDPSRVLPGSTVKYWVELTAGREAATKPVELWFEPSTGSPQFLAGTITATSGRLAASPEQSWERYSGATQLPINQSGKMHFVYKGASTTYESPWGVRTVVDTAVDLRAGSACVSLPGQQVCPPDIPPTIKGWPGGRTHTQRAVIKKSVHVEGRSDGWVSLQKRVRTKHGWSWRYVEHVRVRDGAATVRLRVKRAATSYRLLAASPTSVATTTGAWTVRR